MNEVLSFFSVIALWVGVSLFAWLIHQRRSGSRQHRQTSLARQADSLVAEAQTVFDHVRQGEPREGELVRETHALLKRIQERGAFFDGVNGLRQHIQQALRGEECAPLAEILHIRRDLWAASEIILIEDFRSLGPDFEDESAYARLRGEAASVLFRDGARTPRQEDLIDLRLSLAREEAAQFVADVEEAIRLAREDERLPTFAEIVAYPIAAVRALPAHLRTLRAQIAGFSAQVRAVALTIRQSETMTRGIGELRRAREELPKRVVTGLEKTSSAARHSASSLKGHYDFLVAAYDVQAKYEELLRKAPEATERGKQFIARLELAEKSERLKLTVSDAAKRFAVRALAHLIAGLQRLLVALERRLAAVQDGGDAGPDTATRPARKLGAENPDAARSVILPATTTESEGPRLQAKPGAPARDAGSLGHSEALAARAPRTLSPSQAKQPRAAAPSTAKLAPSSNAPLPGRKRVLGKPTPADQPLPKLSLSNSTGQQTGKEKAAPLTPALGGDASPGQRNAPFGFTGDMKTPPPSLRLTPAETNAAPGSDKPAPSAPSAKAGSHGDKPQSVAAETKASQSAPKKRGGWFPSRRREKQQSPANKPEPSPPPAKGGSRGDKPPAVAAEVKTPQPAPEKRSGWFSSHQPEKQPNPASEPAPGVPSTGAGSRDKPPAVAPAAAEAKAPPKRRGGWFSSRRPEKEPSSANAPALRTISAEAGSRGGKSPSVAAASADAKSSNTVVRTPPVSTDKAAPEKSGRWLASRQSAQQAGGATKAAHGVGAGRTGLDAKSAPAETDAKAAPTAMSAASSDEQAAPQKSGGWFRSRRSKAVAPLSKPVAGAVALESPPHEQTPTVGPATENGDGDDVRAIPAQETAARPAADEAAPAPPPPSAPATAKTSLSAKLTHAAAIDPGAEESDNPDEPEIAGQDAEDDAPGPLTRGILESRAAQREEKPGKNHRSPFPWLRR